MRYWIWPLGCQMNKSDAMRIEHVLQDLGYKKIDDDKKADLIVVVSCSIRQSGIDRIYGKFRWWQKRQRKGELITVLTGCVLDKDIEKFKPKFDLMFNIKDLKKLPKLLKQTDLRLPSNYLKVEPIYSSKFQAVVPIIIGCNNYCTYCAVPYTRGREWSRSSREIIKECKNLVKKGYKEITLLGENVNSYGKDKETEIDFPALLEKIAKLDKNIWIRFTSPHPKDFSEKLIQVIAKYPNICKQINLPVQSGNDTVLKRMNRPYTIKQYTNLINKIKNNIPDVSLSTDIIVGFPGETSKQFADTAKLMKTIKFNMAFIAQYSIRPGTPAAKMKNQVSREIKIKRNHELEKILDDTALDYNKKYLNKEVKVLVEKYRKVHWLGRTEQNVTVRFKAPKTKKLVGEFVDIKIIQVDSFRMEGKLSD
ncbi:MAG: tRNA (N6-isopentenyl adenosine(37)-C2)-methylthiotransferase MiaB [Patescibacteria group bacterium]